MHKMHLEDTLHSDDLKQYDGDKQRSINSLCEKQDTKRKNVKEAHTQREQGCQLTTSSMCLMMEGT